jgi:two-component system phosphate regulon response regulator PhoB
MKRHTILVIDDQRDFRELVGRTLEQEGFDVILASTGASGLNIAEEHKPDLLVLDLTLPDMDGLEICRRLRENPRHRFLPILMISARASAPERVIGLKTGADDYLIKPFVPEELVARVNALLRRVSAPADGAAEIRYGDLQIDLRSHAVSFKDHPVRLTPAEFRILEFLAVHKGRAFSRDEIIDACLGEEENGEVIERTVDTHIVGIRKALGSGADYIQTVRTIGYRFSPP